MSIELLGNVTSIFMAGESHSLAFKDLLFHPSWSKEHFICRTRFLPMLLASEFSFGDGLNPMLADALVADGILDRALRPAFLFVDPNVAYIAGTPMIAPPIVFFGGDTELVGMFKQMADKFDFELPDDPGYGVERSKQPVPYSVIHAKIAKIVDPFLHAIRMLRTHHFSRVMIHCIPPRNTNEEKAAGFTSGNVVPAPLRAKLVIVANRLLQAACAQADIGYIDIWPETTENGYLRPEFALDGIHLNRKAALISLDKISAHLFDHTAHTWNAERYLQLSGQAERSNFVNSGSIGWRELGFVVGQLDALAVTDMARGFAFDMPYNNPDARTDWVGWPRAGRPGVRVAEPSTVALDQALDLLGRNLGRITLQADADYELTVASFRPLRILDTEAPDPHQNLPVPMGVRRALLQLSGGSPIVLESLDGMAIAALTTGIGTLVVYDPQRVRYRIEAGQNDVRLVEMVLIPRLADQPFRVLWAGLCEWPTDPYQFSVLGMKAAPAYAGDSYSARANR